MRNTLGWLWIALLGIAGAIRNGLAGIGRGIVP